MACLLRTTAETAAWLRELYALTKTNAFGACKAALAAAMTDVPPMTAASRLVALLVVLWHESSGDLPLAYLALMAMDETRCWEEHVDDTVVETLVAHVLEAIARASIEEAKVVVKAIEVFSLMSRIVDASVCVDDYVTSLLAVPAGQTSAIKLIALRPTYTWPYAAVLTTLVETKSWPLADQLLKQTQFSLAPETHHDLCATAIALAVAASDMKRAHRLVHAYGLVDRFPDVEVAFRSESLQKLCTQRKWAAAASFVGRNTSLQMMLLKKAVAAGNVELAREWHQRFNLPAEAFPVAAPTTTAISYVALPGTVAIEICDAQDDLQALQACLREALQTTTQPVLVGVDLEWKPVYSKGESSLASLLQVALVDRVFLIDLVHIEGHLNAIDVVHWMLAEPRFLKLGFGFETDVRVLADTFPEVLPIVTVQSLLEIDTVLHHFCPTATAKSLSDVVETVLGLPLDKTQQVSNWDARPLSLDQQMYAALDAWCLVHVTERLAVGAAADWFEPLTTTLRVTSSLSADVATRRRARYELQHRLPTSLARPGAAVAALLASTPDAHVVVSQLSEVDLTANHVVAANTLCVFANQQPMVALLPQTTKLDLGALATATGASRRFVRLAKATECIDIFGYAPGCVPPIAHRQAMPLLVDSSLDAETTLVVGSGKHHVVLQLSLATLRTLVDVRIVPLSKASAADMEATNAKFLVDAHLGKLARWLRMRGIDSVQFTQGENNRDALLDQAAAEARMVLTTDRRLAARRSAAPCFLLTTTDPRDQLRQVLQHFGLGQQSSVAPSFVHPRCTQCNNDTFTLVDAAAAQTKQVLSATTLASVTEFWVCNTCNKVFGRRGSAFKTFASRA
ncbi:hypothetical protein SPRG_19473 [Saprolegnia parasitica CBS 223.65]|uniref:3'-5' exonuclease domain-containing protein n=1 Tax=Saprolegnia parasitica (strain CBS 223.65) TaxID=695850 RepID=A0A067CNB0_SAPPC|nr:hypothetical protein SPRG_19473 [Saprolegnia parasitica CBS 223.65]KDO32008.1 hypothetical protein SPRG_19473 [Saprolegnia parasitica CBS 223.65]|eukprot:XP_012197401.1 hypothetical protein SPRG_19473 [Saprolegnia parasitica CBS 223.65]